jgi:hypothetical protein
LRAPAGVRAVSRFGLLPLGLSLAVLLSCGGKDAAPQPNPLPIGGPSVFTALLDEALRRADPQGAVLVVLWTTGLPPPESLHELTEKWGRYGLIPVNICLDLLGVDADEVASRERAIAGSVHGRRLKRADLGMIYEGDPAALLRSLERNPRPHRSLLE